MISLSAASDDFSILGRAGEGRWKRARHPDDSKYLLFILFSIGTVKRHRSVTHIDVSPSLSNVSTLRTLLRTKQPVDCSEARVDSVSNSPRIMVNKCAVCGVRTDRKKGRTKGMNSQQDIEFYAYHCGQSLAFGDVLCDACRRKRKVDEESDHDDATFDGPVDPALETQGNEELVDFPAPRTAGAHTACIVCKSSENLTVISSSIRRSVFNRANVYIVHGCRTCPQHAIDFETDVGVLKRIPTVSERTLMEVSELKFFFREPQGRHCGTRCIE